MTLHEVRTRVAVVYHVIHMTRLTLQGHVPNGSSKVAHVHSVDVQIFRPEQLQFLFQVFVN